MDRTKIVVVENKMFFFFLSLFVWSCPKVSEARKPRMPRVPRMVPSLFVFGDSQVDVGNNNYLILSIAKANFPRNGIDFPDGRATGRFSNGKIAVDFLAEKLGLPSPQAYLALVANHRPAHMNGVSFASGGSGILDGTDIILGQAMPLTMQVDYFLKVHQFVLRKLGSVAAGKYFSESLIAIMIGSNDILDYFGSQEKEAIKELDTPQQLLDSMFTILISQIKRLHQSGARRFFVSGVGAIGCLPAQLIKNKTLECNVKVNFWAVKFNERVKAVLQELKSELQGLKYSIFDLHGVMEDVIRNPSVYGFKEVKSACCGLGTLRAFIPCLPIAACCPNRNDHVFWDLYHPTEAMARVVADTIFDGPPKYCIPMNVRQLVSS